MNLTVQEQSIITNLLLHELAYVDTAEYFTAEEKKREQKQLKELIKKINKKEV